MLLIDSMDTESLRTQTNESNIGAALEDIGIYGAYVRLKDAYVNAQYVGLFDGDVESLNPVLGIADGNYGYNGNDFVVWEGGELYNATAKSVSGGAFLDGIGVAAQPKMQSRDSSLLIPFQPTSVDLPNVLELGEETFKNCDKLVSVNLPSALGEVSWKNAFAGCTSLANLTLSSMSRETVLEKGLSWGLNGTIMLKCQGESTPQSTTFVYTPVGPRSDMNYRTYTVNQTLLDNFFLDDMEVGDDWPALTGPNSNWRGGVLVDNYAKEVYNSAFDNWDNSLDDVQPTSVSMADVRIIDDYAFECLSELTSASFPLVQYIGEWAFAECPNLVSLELNYMDSSTVVSNGPYWGLPSGCSVVCSDGTITIEPLSKLKYDENNYLSATFESDDDGWEFNGGALVDSNALGVAAYAFDRSISQVQQPTSISLPNATRLDDCAFYGCTQLASANLPSVSYVGYDVFGDCTGLTSLALPSVTDKDNIDNWAFAYSGLTTLELTGLTTSDVLTSHTYWENGIGKQGTYLNFWMVPAECTVTCSDGSLVKGENGWEVVSE